MEPEGSSPHSQAPATCPYPEPAQSSQKRDTRIEFWQMTLKVRDHLK